MIKTKEHQNYEIAMANYLDTETILPCLYDSIFKELFGCEDYPNNSAYLISTFLDIPYQELVGNIHFLNTAPKNITYKSKKGNKDIAIFVDNEEPEKILIEANFRKEKYQVIINRNFYWLANIYGSGVKMGEDYHEIIPTIQLNFNNYFVDPQHKDIIDIYSTRNKHQYELSPTMKTYQINVAEMYQMWYNPSLTVEKIKKV